MENTNTRTDFATMVGLIMGAAIIILGIVTGGGELYWFWNLNSLINCDRWHFCCNNGQSTYESRN